LRGGRGGAHAAGRGHPFGRYSFNDGLASPGIPMWSLGCKVAEQLLSGLCCCCCARGGSAKARSEGASSPPALDQAAYESLMPAAAAPQSAFARNVSVALVGGHAHSFDAVLAALTSRSFPHSLLGSVHTSSVIEIPGSTLSATSPLQGATLRARARWDAGDDRPHRRGTESTVHVTVALAGKEEDSTGTAPADGGQRPRSDPRPLPLWKSETRMLFFKRGGGGKAASTSLPGDAAAAPAATPPLPSSPSLPLSATIDLPSSLPSAWARLSGDVNPIHVHWLCARTFGFVPDSGARCVVAHGMSVVFLALPHAARALQQHCDATGGPGSTEKTSSDSSSYVLTVSFLRPIFCPGVVNVHLSPARSGPWEGSGGSGEAEGAEGLSHQSGGNTATARQRRQPQQHATVVDFQISYSSGAGAPKVCISGSLSRRFVR
jgi:hypothetical protein